jgi:hypothetical protein
VTLATRERIESEADPVGFLISVSRGESIACAVMRNSKERVEVLPTLDQRMSAAGMLSRKISPDAKDNPIRLPLPSLKTAADVLAALDVVAGAMSRGEITPGEAQIVANVLDMKRKAIETVDIESRLVALEQGREQAA